MREIGATTRKKQIEYFKFYLRHYIQLFNSAKNRMQLLMYIKDKTKTSSTGFIKWSNRKVVNNYVRFLRAGVVNVEILRQKLMDPKSTNGALGNKFHQNISSNKLSLASINKLKGTWKETWDGRTEDTDSADGVGNPNQIFERTRTGMSRNTALMQAFDTALSFRGESNLYGNGTWNPRDVHSIKHLYRMFALPNPNEINEPFSNNAGRATGGPALSIDTIQKLNLELIKDLTFRIRFFIGKTEAWRGRFLNNLVANNITTVYRFIYMFRQVIIQII